MAPASRALAALAAATATAAPAPTPAAATILWVNCATGSDTSGSGNASSPWLTLTRARDAVRALQPLTSPVEVRVQSSDCAPRDPVTGAVNYSFPVLELDPAQDSGASPDAAITYTAAPGAAVRLLGGPAVPASAWVPYTGSIVRADLGPGGLDVARYGFGSLAAGGLGTCDDTGMELFWNGTAQTLARWPNIAPNGTWQWANIGSVDAPLEFTTAATRALSWNGVPRAWLHGYWSFDWADSYVQIANVTPSAGGSSATVTVDADTAPLYGFQPKARFMGVNILAELDAPGEYYIDPDAATLYFWPPGGDVAAGEAFLSVADYGVASGVTTRVLSDGRAHPWVPYAAAREHGKRPARPPVRGAPTLPEPAPSPASAAASGSLSYVTLSGLNTYFTRQRGIAIAAGTGVTIRDLESSCHGHNGVTVAGTGNALVNVTVVDTGCQAMSVAGGDLATLTPGGNTVTGSAASRYARVIRTYNPGIGWGGVGNTFAYNTITDAPHNGILGGGALNTFANNTFDKLCYEATDSGAWYAGRSWTNRGNVLFGNAFTRIANLEHMTLGAPSVQAIYLDDELSGTVITGNSCADSQTCYFVGGGRDTVVSGNTCARVGTCVHLDNRGMGWQADACAYNATYTGLLVAGLFAVNYTQPPYSTAFPPIVATLANHPCVPVNVSVTGNSYCGTETFIDATAAQTASWFDIVEGNTNTSVPGGGCPSTGEEGAAPRSQRGNLRR